MNKRVESFFKVLLLLNVTERDLSTNPFQNKDQLMALKYVLRP